jgi:hypothetical protein
MQSISKTRDTITNIKNKKYYKHPERYKIINLQKKMSQSETHAKRSAGTQTA